MSSEWLIHTLQKKHEIDDDHVIHHKDVLFDLRNEALANDDIDGAIDIMDLSIKHEKEKKKNYVQGIVIGSLSTLAGCFTGLIFVKYVKSQQKHML